VDLEGPAIADGEWHTLSCTFDRDGVARIYTDGVFSEEQDISGLGSLDVDGRLFFGADAVSGYGMEGAVAEVRYWNAVLSAAEIADWHCSELTDLHPSIAALRGYWELNEGTGDFLEDASGLGHHAVNEGGVWGSDEGLVVWDYSNTPRLVDVPVTALAHMCVPIEDEWDLDGAPLLGTCFPPTSESCSEDLDGDGAVTIADLLLVLGAFGQLCPE
jgi:hypothetical protein